MILEQIEMTYRDIHREELEYIWIYAIDEGFMVGSLARLLEGGRVRKAVKRAALREGVPLGAVRRKFR